MLKRNVICLGQLYEALLIPEDDGGFSVSVPGLPGAYSDGDTEAEALENIVDAITTLKESEGKVAAILKARRDGPQADIAPQPSETEVATD